MTVLTPECPTCGKPTWKAGWACAACLQATMNSMTAEDWSREIGAICNDVIGSDGESADKESK